MTETCFDRPCGCWETFSEQETLRVAEELGRRAAPGEVYALDGELGSGKTVFARGFARGLGITKRVQSPTFTMVHEYHEGRIPLYHFDIYRLPDEDALWDIGWEDYLAAGGVCLVEWASQLAGSMPPDTRWITIEKDYAKGEQFRRITLRRQETQV